jgi:hypothetical protein
MVISSFFQIVSCVLLEIESGKVEKWRYVVPVGSFCAFTKITLIPCVFIKLFASYVCFRRAYSYCSWDLVSVYKEHIRIALWDRVFAKSVFVMLFSSFVLVPRAYSYR